MCNWFVVKKLSIHFGEGKTKSILFGTKRKLKCNAKLEINRVEIKIKQHNEVKYFVCSFHCNLSGGSTAVKVLNKINSTLRFFCRKQNNLNASLRSFLCNTLILPHIDYVYQAWFPNIGKREFCTINWLPVDKRFHVYVQCR